MISKSTINRIQDEARVDEVIGEFLPLKKRGVNFLTNCPFHNEKTPSFTISPTKNLYKCFGCGKAGGAVTFLMDYQQLSYVDALKYLAKKYNIEVEEIFEERTKEEEEAQSKLDSIYIANVFAQKYYHDTLLSENGTVGLSYLKERGYDLKTIEKFQLGYATEKYDGFLESALKNGYRKDILLEARLISEKENRNFDFFRNRVMFPVHNLVGKVVGFGGRIMVKDEKSPKYLNTPESEAYQKSKLLYGIFYAKQAIRKADECFLVEGYTDVISLHQAGIENVVASSGTAFTEEQARLIKRLTSNVTILYDGDVAGIKAAKRGSDILIEQGLNVKVVLLPEPEDPDSYVRMVGTEEFLKYISERKKDFILFKTQISAPEAKSDPAVKTALIRDLVLSISKVQDPIQRSIYTKECASLLDVPEQIMIVEVNKQRKNNKLKENPEASSNQNIGSKYDFQPTEEFHREQLNEATDNLNYIERDIIRTLLEFGSKKMMVDDNTETTVLDFVIQELEGIKLVKEPYNKLFNFIDDEYQKGNIYEPSYFTSMDSNIEFSILATDLLFEKYTLSPNWWSMHKVVVPDRKNNFISDVESAIIRIKQRKINEMIEDVDAKLKSETHEETITKLLQEKNKLIKKRKELYSLTGTVVYNPVKK